jgi:hypothetical protein
LVIRFREAVKHSTYILWGCVLALLATVFAAIGCAEITGVDFEKATLRGGTGSAFAACGAGSCAGLGFECGSQFDACGQPIDCGVCSDGRACEAGKCACNRRSCAEAGFECGTQPDGCGGAMDCGRCANPAEACVDGKCKCQPKTCAAQNAECGTLPDSCGSTYACGGCSGNPAGNICGGGGPNRCGNTACTPTTCAAQGKNCGSISDGCGVTLNCGGGCSAPQTCGGGGVANVCGCTPTTCAAQGKNCGLIPNGCGGTLDCGSCAAPNTCAGGGIANVCGCTSTSICSECCTSVTGPGVDNCGRPCYRNTCCSGGGGGGCFGAGTPVRMADGSTKPIELVRAGDLVTSHDPITGATYAARVLALRVHGPETSADGFLLVDGVTRVTPNHPVWIGGVRHRADALVTGSIILSTAGSLRTVMSLPPDMPDVFVRTARVRTVTRLPGGESTYDLWVEGKGTFFAGNLLVEQKQLQ